MKVRALIGPMSSAAGREGIVRLLAAAPAGYRSAIAADQCDVWEEVLERLAAEPFDVLITELGPGSPAVERLFQLQPSLFVIEVDLVSGTTNIYVLDVGSLTLVRLAEWLAREAGLAGSNDTITRVTDARPKLPIAGNQPSEGADAKAIRETKPPMVGNAAARISPSQPPPPKPWTGAATISFDSPPRIDRVTLAIGAVDAVTGTLIRDGVSACMNGLMDRPIVNASGMLVFINLPDRPQYDVEVDGRRAGFPFVERFAFTPPAKGNKDPAARRRDVLLAPGPDYPFAPGTTLVRGVVTRGSAPVEGAAISAAPSAGGGSFATRSIANGAFALALRLPPVGTDEADAPQSVTIEMSEGGDRRSFLRPIDHGRGHSFLEPIDLTGSNDPGFFAP